MSTNDVPGSNPANADKLAMGCWAEHKDGSLIFVESVEGGSVIYSIFDVAKTPPVEYRDAMPEIGFKSQFSWSKDKKIGKDLLWTWHDKTPFPWQRIMKNFAPGQKAVSADDIKNAAERVGESLQLRANRIDVNRIPTQQQKAARHILRGIEEAMAELDGN